MITAETQHERLARLAREKVELGVVLKVRRGRGGHHALCRRGQLVAGAIGARSFADAVELALADFRARLARQGGPS